MFEILVKTHNGAAESYGSFTLLRNLHREFCTGGTHFSSFPLALNDSCRLATLPAAFIIFFSLMTAILSEM